jgi:hypothetical protein
MTVGVFGPQPSCGRQAPLSITIAIGREGYKEFLEVTLKD